MEPGHATLSAHRPGSVIVTREELDAIPAPPGTKTHRPITHKELIGLIQERVEVCGYHIAREAYAVQREGLKLFGTLDLTNGGSQPLGPDVGLAIGLRHANDKTMSLEMVAGGRVFVCDNLALSGDARLFRYPHRPGVMGRLHETLGHYFGGLGKQLEQLKGRFQAWRDTALTDVEAKALLYDSIALGVIPIRLREEIHAAYFRAATLGFEDCAPRSLYGLHNAFTRSIKTMRPEPAYEANLELTRLFTTT